MSTAAERGKQLVEVLMQPLARELWEVLGLRIDEPLEPLLALLAKAGDCKSVEDVGKLVTSTLEVTETTRDANFCLLVAEGCGTPESYALLSAMAAIASGLCQTACVHNAEGICWAVIPCPGTWEAEKETEVPNEAIDLYEELIGGYEEDDVISDRIISMPLSTNLDLIEDLVCPVGWETWSKALWLERACVMTEHISSAQANRLLGAVMPKLPFLLPGMARLVYKCYDEPTPLNARLVGSNWTCMRCRCGLPDCKQHPPIIGRREVVNCEFLHEPLQQVDRYRLMQLV